MANSLYLFNVLFSADVMVILAKIFIVTLTMNNF